MRYKWVWNNQKGYVKKCEFELGDIFKGIVLFFVGKKIINIAWNEAKSIIDKYFKDMTQQEIIDKIVTGFKTIDKFVNIADDSLKIAKYIADNLDDGINNLKFEITPEKIETLSSILKNFNEIFIDNPEIKETIDMLTDVIDYSIQYSELGGE